MALCLSALGGGMVARGFWRRSGLMPVWVGAVATLLLLRILRPWGWLRTWLLMVGHLPPGVWGDLLIPSVVVPGAGRLAGVVTALRADVVLGLLPI